MVLALSETHYIPKDRRKQPLFLPVQNTRIIVVLSIV